MSKVEIYTKFTCGFCFRAKALLENKNVSFEETDISMGGSKREEMIQRSGDERVAGPGSIACSGRDPHRTG